jgi:hypothetical protein
MKKKNYEIIKNNYVIIYIYLEEREEIEGGLVKCARSQFFHFSVSATFITLSQS